MTREEYIEGLKKLEMPDDLIRRLLTEWDMGIHETKSHVTLFRYMTLQGLISTIKTGLLKVGQAKYFNDPFEFLPGRHPNGYCNNTVNTLDLNKKGIICLSETPSSSAMWGHYADSHKGVCLSFHIPKDDFSLITNNEDILELFQAGISPSRLLLQVKYGIKRYHYPKIVHVPNSIEEDMEIYAHDMELARTKSDEWQYEKEWRLILDEQHITDYQDGICLTNILTPYLSQIFLGVRCESTAMEVDALIKKTRKYFADNGQPYFDEKISVWPCILDIYDGYRVVCNELTKCEDGLVQTTDMLVSWLRDTEAKDNGENSPSK